MEYREALEKLKRYVEIQAEMTKLDNEKKKLNAALKTFMVETGETKHHATGVGFIELRTSTQTKVVKEKVMAYCEQNSIDPSAFTKTSTSTSCYIISETNAKKQVAGGVNTKKG